MKCFVIFTFVRHEKKKGNTGTVTVQVRNGKAPAAYTPSVQQTKVSAVISFIIK